MVLTPYQLLELVLTLATQQTQGIISILAHCLVFAGYVIAPG